MAQSIVKFYPLQVNRHLHTIQCHLLFWCIEVNGFSLFSLLPKTNNFELQSEYVTYFEKIISRLKWNISMKSENFTTQLKNLYLKNNIL